jgi:hypothetical protein
VTPEDGLDVTAPIRTNVVSQSLVLTRTMDYWGRKGGVSIVVPYLNVESSSDSNRTAVRGVSDRFPLADEYLWRTRSDPRGVRKFFRYSSLAPASQVRGSPNVASIAQRERLQALECVANEIGLAYLTASLDDFIPQVDEDICHAVTKGRCLETPQQPIERRRLGLHITHDHGDATGLPDLGADKPRRQPPQPCRPSARTVWQR